MQVRGNTMYKRSIYVLNAHKCPVRRVIVRQAHRHDRQMEVNWDGDSIEHFPDVMPYNVNSLRWSSKRRNLKVEENKQWQEEMHKLKSNWHTRGAEEEACSNSRRREERDKYFEDWCWQSHLDALNNWEEQKKSWSTDRVRAHRVAQQRLDSYRSNSFNKSNRDRVGAAPSVALPDISFDPLGFYAILGVKPNATVQEIKEAYKCIVKKDHPDLNPHLKNKSESKMKQLNEAYKILKNVTSRREYDAHGIASL